MLLGGLIMKRKLPLTSLSYLTGELSSY